MEKMLISSHRIQRKNDLDRTNGSCVVYWMQQSQRADDNHALEYAVEEANGQKLPLVVLFVLMDHYPEANLRHYTFMLEGVKETQAVLASRGIRMIIQIGNPVEEVLWVSRNAAMVVCDRGYLRHQRAWRREIARNAPCAVVQVESDVIVPIHEVSDKAEYAAYTIRPKIHRMLDLSIEKELPARKPIISSIDTSLEDLLLRKGIDSPEKRGGHSVAGSPERDGVGLEERVSSLDPLKILDHLTLDRTVSPVSHFFKGGTAEAKRRFADFLENRAANYVINRNQPQTQDLSMMSPYLHFGQISPHYLVRQIKTHPDIPDEVEAVFLEELIVRRELAVNFVYFHPDYDRLDSLPNWAKTTLADHRNDPRDFTYTYRQLENGETHDPYWNAAMAEMRITGFMHNYMRMYWGKKVLEWSDSPKTAYETLLSLNNTYFLDGRDPNSYAGVGWIFGLHDRAWKERPVYGKVRYMAASGLERKCDIMAYVRRMDALLKFR